MGATAISQNTVLSYWKLTSLVTTSAPSINAFHDAFMLPLSVGSESIKSLCFAHNLHQLKLTNVLLFSSIVLSLIISDFPYFSEVDISILFHFPAMFQILSYIANVQDTNENFLRRLSILLSCHC